MVAHGIGFVEAGMEVTEPTAMNGATAREWGPARLALLAAAG